MKKYIFLDIDNTLLDFNKCSKISIQEGFKKYGITYHEDVFDTFVKINDSQKQSCTKFVGIQFLEH